MHDQQTWTGIIPLVAWVACVSTAHAAESPAPQPVYQWAVPVTKPDGKRVIAYLWIPPAAERVRGVIIGGDPSLAAIAEDPALRAAAAAEKLAIIAVRPHFDSIFHYKDGDGPRVFQKILDELASVSGYREIAVAPFFSFGHSVSCNYATAAACWKPERCFGVLVFKGGLVMPSYDPLAEISGIPILAIKGQFEEFGPGPSGVLRDFEDRETSWKHSRERYLKLRQDNERILVSLMVEAGTTHMAWSPRDGEYVGLFLRKAAQARIPDWSVTAIEAVHCKKVDFESGALTSTAITNPQAPKAAPYKQYKGDRKATYWHVDLELAQASEAFHAIRFNKRAQFVTFVDVANGKPIYSRHDLRFSIDPVYVGPDTFKVAGAFLNEARDKYAVPEPPLGHAEGPIRFRVFGGSIEQVGDDTFRVRMKGRGNPGGAIVAYHPGDNSFRYAEQPAGLKLAPLTKGKPQTITFPPLTKLTADSNPVKLNANSDSGLPVAYFVASGPAVIDNGALRITGIPPRAKFPLSVTVGAYQWGSAVEPLVQTAVPSMQTVEVGK